MEHRKRHASRGLGQLSRRPDQRRAVPDLLLRPGHRAAQQRPPLPQVRHRTSARSKTRRCRDRERRPASATTTCATTRTGPSATLLTSADLADLTLGAERLRTGPRRRHARPRPPGPLHLRGADRERDRSRRQRRRMRRQQTEPLHEVGLGAPAADQPAARRLHRHARRDSRRAERGDLRAMAPASTGPTGRTSTCATATRPNRSTQRRAEADLPDRQRRRLGRLLHQGRPPLALRRRHRVGHRPDAGRRRAGSARRLRRRHLRLLRSTTSRRALFLWHSGVVTPVAASVAADSYPPTTGTARVSADGRHLLFVSSAFELTGYDSRNIGTGIPDPEVYLFTAPGAINSGHRLRFLQPVRGKADRRRQPARRLPQRSRAASTPTSPASSRRTRGASSSTPSTRSPPRTPTKPKTSTSGRNAAPGTASGPTAAST